MAAILHRRAVAFRAVKYAGGGNLLYLAWSRWLETDALHFDTPAIRRGMRQIITRGFLINILNPKLFIFSLPSCCCLSLLRRLQRPCQC